MASPSDVRLFCRCLGAFDGCQAIQISVHIKNTDKLTQILMKDQEYMILLQKISHQSINAFFLPIREECGQGILYSGPQSQNMLFIVVFAVPCIKRVQ